MLGFYLNHALCTEDAIGLESEDIPNNNITASSYETLRPPSAARLGSHGSWCPLDTNNAFLQVDLGVAYYVCAVATQGHAQADMSVQRYSAQLSFNGTHWIEYEQVKYSHTRSNQGNI